MNRTLRLASLAIASAAVLALTACGGGSDAPATAPAPAPAATTSVPVTVIDGALKNATVCLDKNTNGVCDAGEPSGKTDVNGNVSLTVANADVGKYPILAIVGTDAIDADTGPVTVAYTLQAPADKPAVVSPLTTLVQQTIASTGVSTTEAAKAVQDATGITVSLFQDFTKVAAPTDGSPSAATVARMVVVTTQQQSTVVAGAAGTTATDGATISKADLDKAIQKKLLELLPSIIAALSDPAYLAATTPAAKEAALLSAATTIVSSSGLTTASVATVVAINNQNSGTPVAVAAPAAGFSLDSLTFNKTNSWFVRALTNSLAQATPDANNKTKYVERRIRSAGGVTSTWGLGSDPWRNADLNWNGTAWVNCPVNFENTSSVRDAQGNSNYSYCDARETGKSNRATFDIAGKTMLAVYNDTVAAGFTNLTINGTLTTLLGTATFPADSKIFYQTNTPLTEAVSYYPGSSNFVQNYSSGISTGGGTAASPTTACTSTEAQGSPTNTTATLEAMIAVNKGTPCVYGTSTFTANSTTFDSGGPNSWWGQSSLGIGTIGTTNVSSTPTAFFTDNTIIRMSFAGTGTNPVTYYSCKQRFQNGSPRNCTVIGTGNYTIATLGDARIMTLSSMPPQAAALGYNRVFVERGGKIWYGYQNKPTVTSKARLNMAASNALFAKLGMPVTIDPAVPVALTQASYAGDWTVTDGGPGNTTIRIANDGTSKCYADLNFSSPIAGSCTATVNPSNGAASVVFSGGTDDGTFTATFNFLTGDISGGSFLPLSGPPAVVITGARR